MTYQLIYKASLKKDLRKLTLVNRRAVIRRILSLATDPRPSGATKLTASGGLYRVRQGEYRIIYNVHDDTITVEIIKVGHRSDVYR
jgi:mRNA interferase RelE/StbE